MRRIFVAVMGTISGLVLLFSYHTSTNATQPTAAAPATPTNDSTGPTPSSTPTEAEPDTSPTTQAPSPAPTSTSSPSGSSAVSTPSAGTFTGSAVNTRWGLVQVEVTVLDGKITAARAVQYPQNNGRDQEINAYALPILAQEVTQAQSASIDAVSGATVTSEGYIQSLQSALDQAHL